MNKYKILMQKLTRQAIVSGIVVAVSVAVYVGITMVEEDALESQKKVEETLAKDKSLLASYTSQMEKSGDAEKRFDTLVGLRASNHQALEGTRDAFKIWLLSFRDKVRVTVDPKSTLCEEKPSDKADLTTLQGYLVFLCSGTSLSITAPTDVHVFSFIEEMRRSMPGLVRIDRVELKRTGDLTDGTIDGFRQGNSPTLVSGKLEFSVVGIRPKSDQKDNAKDKSGAAKP